jgi:hypothetical protein
VVLALFAAALLCGLHACVATALPVWADAEGPVISGAESLRIGGGNMVVEDAKERTLRFMAPPSSAFSQWNAGPGDSDWGVTPTIDDFVGTPSGAAWVKLEVDERLVGFERVAAPGVVVTPRRNPCAEDEDVSEVELFGVGSDERLWVRCSQGLSTIAVDGTVARVDCAPCLKEGNAYPAAADGAMWFVNGDDGGGWDLRLVSAAGVVIGARHFHQPTPFELVDNGQRLVWLRERSGVPAGDQVVEGLTVDAWQTAPPVPFTHGLSERLGRAVAPARPEFQSLANTADGSTWFLSWGFARVVRVDAAGTVMEFPVSTKAALPDSLVHIGDRIWVRMRNAHLYRVPPGGAARSSLPFLNQRLRIHKRRHADRRPGQPIAFLSALSISSGRALPGTRVSIRCLTHCRGKRASGVIVGSRLRINTGIYLYNHAKLETVATLGHRRSTSQVFELTRGKGRAVRNAIVAIDGVPLDKVFACGC